MNGPGQLLSPIKYMIYTMAGPAAVASVNFEPWGWEAAAGREKTGSWRAKVSEEAQPESTTPAKRLAKRLEFFYQSLPEDEKAIMRRIIRLAVEQEDVRGYAGSDLDTPESEQNQALPEPHPIDEFRVNLAIFLEPDA